MVDVDQDERAAAIAREVAGELGQSELPIVLCEDGSRWTGLQLERIAGLGARSVDGYGFPPGVPDEPPGGVGITQLKRS